jgi:hypothetical protein
MSERDAMIDCEELYELYVRFARLLTSYLLEVLGRTGAASDGIQSYIERTYAPLNRPAFLAKLRSMAPSERAEFLSTVRSGEAEFTSLKQVADKLAADESFPLCTQSDEERVRRYVPRASKNSFVG